MNTRNYFIGLLLLMMATFTSEVFAQSAEEAAKYGQLQEIQVPAAGKLGKFIKKADPNTTALKISGELNTKDLALLFSLPNIAYLDMKDVTYANYHNYRYEYMEEKEKKYVDVYEHDFLLMCSNTLRYLVLPSKTLIIVIPDNYFYSLDMLVVDGWYNMTGFLTNSGFFRNGSPDCGGKRFTPSNITFSNVKVLPENYMHGNYQNGEDALTKKHIKNSVGYILGNEERSDYNHYYNSISRNERDNIHTLYIPTENALKWSVVEKFNPEEIIIESTGKRILNHYIDKQMLEKKVQIEKKVEEEIDKIRQANPRMSLRELYHLTEMKADEIMYACMEPGEAVDARIYDEIREYAFAGSTVTSVTLSDKIKILPKGCFFNCRYLTTVNMPAVEKLEEYTFRGATGLALSEYKFPANIQEFDATSLPSNIKVVNLTHHQYAPTINSVDSLGDVEFIIPKGARKYYSKGDWKYLHVTEEGAQDTYIFQCDSIGALKQFLTEDIIPNVKNLTIKGVLGETDFAILRRCVYLKYLNLSDCFTFEETQCAKERYAEAAAYVYALNAAAQMSSEMSQLQYQNHEITTEEAIQKETASQVLQAILPKTLTPEEMDKAFGRDRVIWSTECYFPQYALGGLWRLETLVLPQKLIGLLNDLFKDNSEKKHLKKVQFSDEMIVIGNYIFAGASNLKEINIPSNLMIIGKGCFRGCAFESVDLRNTKIPFWTLSDASFKGVESYGLTLDAFFDCPLKEFYTPRKISVAKGCEWIEGSAIEKRYGVYIGGSFNKRMETKNKNQVKLYFYFEEPFCSADHIENIYGKAAEIHIPRGMKAAWRGYPNIIDDIDL